jgi:hypothetical protein
MFGVAPSIQNQRTDGDIMRLVFQHGGHVQPPKLKATLKEHLRGFREVFS